MQPMGHYYGWYLPAWPPPTSSVQFHYQPGSCPSPTGLSCAPILGCHSASQGSVDSLDGSSTLSSGMSWDFQLSGSPSCLSMKRGAVSAEQLDGHNVLNLRPHDFRTLQRALEHSHHSKVEFIIRNCDSTFKPREQAFTSLISTFSKRQDWKKAVAVFEAMKRLSPDVRTNTFSYTAVISACAQNAQIKRALAYYSEMVAAAKEDAGCSPNAYTYSAVLSACSRDNIHQALEVFEDMLENGVKADDITFSVMILACSRHFMWDKVDMIVNVMHRQGLTATSDTYRKLMDFYASTVNWERATDLLLVLQYFEMELSPSMCRSLLRVYCKCNKGEMALVVIRAMQANGINVPADLLDDVALMLSDCGLWQELLDILESLPSRSLGSEAEVLVSGRCHANLLDCSPGVKTNEGLSLQQLLHRCAGAAVVEAGAPEPAFAPCTWEEPAAGVQPNAQGKTAAAQLAGPASGLECAASIGAITPATAPPPVIRTGLDMAANTSLKGSVAT